MNYDLWDKEDSKERGKVLKGGIKYDPEKEIKIISKWWKNEVMIKHKININFSPKIKKFNEIILDKDN